MAEDDKFQKMETFRRFLKEPLPPLVKKYISNGHWKYFETFVKRHRNHFHTNWEIFDKQEWY